MSVSHTHNFKILIMISDGVLVKGKILYMASHNLSSKLGHHEKMDHDRSTGVNQGE